MRFQIVILWSDALLFLLLAICAGGAWWARGREQLALAWRRVGSSGVAVASATVLGFFLVTAVLDSLHYREQLKTEAGQKEQYAVEVRSVLDLLLSHQRLDTEKTYSAPLATHLFAKETRTDGAGRDYPRLRHGGTHLGESAQQFDGDWSTDIGIRALLGLAAGAGFAALLALALRPLRGRAPWFAWKPCLVAFGACCASIGLLAALAQQYHVLGTDKVGQDVLYLALKSVRTGLLIGTLTTLVMLPAAVFFGILAGYKGGWVDDIIQYVYTVLNSIPGVLLIAASILMMQVVIDSHPDWFPTSATRADARLMALCVIMGVTSWTGLCRLLRAETLKLRELEYVQAARAFGVSSLVIMGRHILPNVMHIVMISVVMDFSGLVLAEAVLSYVGVGVDPTTISFGTMINMARMELAREPMVWWSLAAAFFFMFALVLAANLFADVVRDAFDPRGRVT